jgi:HSP20 family molecular chaperone IbpA
MRRLPGIGMVACCKDWIMSRITPFASPLLLGFDAMEKTLERLAKANDGYPPYNIERILPDAAGNPERLRITLAVAGFSEAELEVMTEENQLVIRGRQVEQAERDYLYRGIAARQFQRVFVLADGMQVSGAGLKNGLLSIDLIRPEPARMVRKINISVSE